MKKVLSLFLAMTFVVLSLGSLTVGASAASLDSNSPSPEVRSANFYLLNEGLTVPVGTASEPTKNYSFAGEGTISASEAVYNDAGVDEYIVSAPSVELKEGQSILWYVVKSEVDGWHVDGVIVPFYSVVYASGCDDAIGSTTDPTHYFKEDTITVKENGFTRDGYTFLGWNTEIDGSGIAYGAGNTIEASNLSFDKAINVITLYAQWEKMDDIVDPDPVLPVDPVNHPIAPIAPIDPAEGEKISLGIVVPHKMAVRFEDGTVYYGGESIDIEIGKTYRFQMCSVNWDNGIYDDYSNGICGTVIYSVRVSDDYTERSYDAESKSFVLPKGDPVLRTDVNKCFMAYRYHFAKGDYNKQTGIVHVVNTPLESLSVNLPLGSTITSDAYKAYNQIDSADVFVENNNGEGIYQDVYLTCVNDYYWQY